MAVFLPLWVAPKIPQRGKKKQKIASYCGTWWCRFYHKNNSIQYSVKFHLVLFFKDFFPFFLVFSEVREWKPRNDIHERSWQCTSEIQHSCDMQGAYHISHHATQSCSEWLNKHETTNILDKNCVFCKWAISQRYEHPDIWDFCLVADVKGSILWKAMILSSL